MCYHSTKHVQWSTSSLAAWFGSVKLSPSRPSAQFAQFDSRPGYDCQQSDVQASLMNKAEYLENVMNGTTYCKITT